LFEFLWLLRSLETHFDHETEGFRSDDHLFEIVAMLGLDAEQQIGGDKESLFERFPFDGLIEKDHLSHLLLVAWWFWTSEKFGFVLVPDFQTLEEIAPICQAPSDRLHCSFGVVKLLKDLLFGKHFPQLRNAENPSTCEMFLSHQEIAAIEKPCCFEADLFNFWCSFDELSFYLNHIQGYSAIT